MNDSGMPFGIKLATGVVGVVSASFVAAALGLPAGYAVMAATAAVVAFLARDLRVAACVTSLAWLIFDGFIVNRMGVLTYQATPDAGMMLGFAGAALVGHILGRLRGAISEVRQHFIVVPRQVSRTWYAVPGQKVTLEEEKYDAG